MIKTFEADVRITFILDAPDEETVKTLIDWECKQVRWAERHRWERLLVIAEGDEEEGRAEIG